VGAPEDEDQDRIRCAGQFNSFVNPPIRIVPLERRTPPWVVPLMSSRGCPESVPLPGFRL
jgi:hypothetical protein